MEENKDLINASEIERLIGDVDLASDIDENRNLSDEDLKDTKIEKGED